MPRSLKPLKKLTRISLGVLVILALAGTAGYLLTRPPTQPGQCSYMQPIDSKLLDLPSDFPAVSSSPGTPVTGRYLTYSTNTPATQETFTLKDSQGKSYEVTLTLNSPAGVNWQPQSHTDAVDNIFKFPSSQSPAISYQVELPPGLILDDSLGGFITVKVQSTSEELLMFKFPQGIDSTGQRIDFSLQLDRNTVSLTPLRDWQLGCTQSQITLHSQITAVAWSEALVMVGDNCDGDACLKDGDILQVRPAGWNWGTDEKKKFALVKIPKTPQSQRDEYASRTIDHNPEEQGPLEDQPEAGKPRIFAIPDLARYAVDYTALATPAQLKDIRNPQKDSPVLDATTNPDVIKKKPDPRLSIIPTESRLAYPDAQNLAHTKSLWDRFFPTAKAAGVLVKTIGTASGRNYSDIQTWENAWDDDLTAVQEIRVGELYKDSPFYLTAAVTIDGFTTSASYYPVLTAAAGDRHTGKAGTGVRIDGANSTSAGCIEQQDSYVRIEWIEFTKCGQANGRGAIRLTGGNTGILIQNVIIHDYANSSVSAQGITFGNDTVEDTATVRNCLVYDGDSSALNADPGSSPYDDDDDFLTADNCTIYLNIGQTQGQRGVDDAGGGQFTITNTISMSTTAADYETDNVGSSQSYNISEDTTATGTGSLTSRSTTSQFVSTTDGSEDFHLKAGSDAINAGTTISGFSNDIDLESRPFGSAWDMGADEFTPKDPVSFWNFDEANGSTANDSNSSVSNNDLTITNALWKTSDLCVFGNCLYFDGNADYATKSYSSDTELLPGTASFTVSAWFKHTSTAGADTLISRADAVAGVGWKVYMDSSGYMCFGIDDTATSFPSDSACTTTSYADSQWHYVTAVKSTTASITVYIDGQQAGQDASLLSTLTLNGTNAPITVGNDFDNGTNGWDGFIDEVKYYNFAKTANQITTEYASKSTPKGTSASFGAGDAATSLNQGLVGYWKMDDSGVDAEGETSTDSSGNSNTGTLYGDNGVGDNGTGMNCTATGKFGTGCDLDGTDDYVMSLDSTSLDMSGTDQFTISAWIKADTLPSAGTSVTLINKDDTSNNAYRFYLGNYDGAGSQLYIQARNTSNTVVTRESTTAESFSTGTWYHVVGVLPKSGSKLLTYINGVDKSSWDNGSFSGTLKNGDWNLFIGTNCAGCGANFDGTIDDVRIYNRALSPAEVASLYNWAAPPVGYWKLDEGTGTSVSDSTGNSAAGSFQGSPLWQTGKFGTALKFNRSNDPNVSVGSATALDDLPQLTITAWINPDAASGGNERIIGKNGSNNVGWMVQYDNSERLNLTVDYDTTNLYRQTSNNLITVGAWQHIAVTWTGSSDATNVKFYINGVEQAYGTTTNGSTTRVTDNTANVCIGSRCSQVSGFGGLIDDVRIYNYVRTGKQIIEDMNAGHPAPGSPVGSYAARWKFDDMSGTTAQDTSDNNNDLTLSTASWTTSGKFTGAWNGTNALWLSRADDADFDFAVTEDFSVSTWFKSDSATNPAATEYLVNKASSVIAGYAVYANTSGQICFGIDDDTTWGPDVASCSATDYYDGTWHYVTAIRNVALDTNYLYIDGISRDSDSDTTTATLANSLSLYVGDRDGVDNGDEFAGDLDEIKIFRFALSSSEVLLDMNFGSAAALGAVTDHDSEGFGGNPPVGWWKMDENSGTAANDSSGNGLTGTLTGGPIWDTGKIGSAVRFNRIDTDEYVEVSDSSTLDPATNMTLTAWFKLDILATTKGEDQKIFVHRHSTGNNFSYSLEVDTTDDDIAFSWVDSAGTSYLTSSYNDITSINTWYHVVAVKSGTALSLYINGINRTEFTEVTSANNTLNGDLSARIGATSSNSKELVGIVDDVRLYDYARTQAQIAYDYNRGAPVAWYKFDECTGYSVFDAATKADGTSDAKVATVSATLAGGNTTVDNCNSGNTADMRYNGSTGKFNNALDFDGTDDYVEVMTEPSSLDFADSRNFSLEAWINRETFTTDDTVIAKKTTQDNTTAGYILWVDDSTDDVRLVVSDGDSANLHTVDSTTTFTSSGWHHVVVVYDDAGSTASKIYIDGVDDIATNTTSGTFSSIGDLSNSVKLRFGAESDVSPSVAENPFDGKIDNVKLYNYAVSATQVKTLYNEGFAQRFGPQTGSP